ncbi:hypothetical protein DL98DRAFT_273152 [Cadophora sp. DSE1049]|nr:hypothetical protein DL98DRAFT_273152 [Cadophora sp. DSE1049]
MASQDFSSISSQNICDMSHNPALVARFPGPSTAAAIQPSTLNPTRLNPIQSNPPSWTNPNHHSRTCPPTVCMVPISAGLLDGWPGLVCNTTFAAPLQIPSRSRNTNTNTNMIPSLSLRSRNAGQWSVIQSRPKASKASHQTQHPTSSNPKTCHLSLLSQVRSRFVSPKLDGFGLGGGNRFASVRSVVQGCFSNTKTNSGIERQGRGRKCRLGVVSAHSVIRSTGHPFIHPRTRSNPTQHTTQHYSYGMVCSELPEMTIRCATFETRSREAFRGRW